MFIISTNHQGLRKHSFIFGDYCVLFICLLYYRKLIIQSIKFGSSNVLQDITHFNICSPPSGPYEEMKLTINTPMDTIVRTMAAPDSGLEIRDRMWLKITIPNAFIGECVLQAPGNTKQHMSRLDEQFLSIISHLVYFQDLLCR